MSDKFEDTITLKAGSSTVIEVPYMASPKPMVKWTWKSPLKGSHETSPRFKPDTEVLGLTSLPMARVKREDAGDYIVTISNELGDVTATVHVFVLDKPSPPQNFEAVNNTGDTVDLKWEEPEFTGDERGTALEYIVEMRETSMRSTKPITKTTDLKTTVEGLEINKSYAFSVAAKNSVGQSDFVEIKPVSTKLKFGKFFLIVWLISSYMIKLSLIARFQGVPATPKNVRAKLTPERGIPADQIIELSWDQPVIGHVTPESKPEYLIEMKQEDTDRWVTVSMRAPIIDTIIIIPLEMMAEGKNYQFRVAAKNKAGTSPFSEPSPRMQKRKFLQTKSNLVAEICNRPLPFQLSTSSSSKSWKISVSKNFLMMPSSSARFQSLV